MKNQQLLLLAYTFSDFSGGVFGPIYAYFVQKVGGGILETASAFAIFSIACGISTLIATRLNSHERYNLHLLAIGWFLWLLSVLSYIAIDSVSKLFIAQVLNGLGNALSAPTFDAEFSKDSQDNLLLGWGNFEAVTNTIAGIAALLGGAIAYYAGFKILIYVMISTACVSFLILLYYIKLKINQKNNFCSK